MRQQTLLLVGVLALVGCAAPRTERGFDQAMQKWVGGNINDVYLRMGPPTRTDVLPNGMTMYTWSKSVAGTTPIYVTPTYTAPSQTTVNVVGNTAYATTTPGTTTGGQIYGGQPYVSSCTFSFVTDKSQRVTSYRFDGNSCRWQERK